jgi:fatty acid desaturase
MEPLDSDLDYVVRERKPSRFATRNARFNWLLIVPGLGLLWVLYLIGAALFQWDVSNVVGPVMVLMILGFLLLGGLLFWANSPKAND